jgi:hypothetical protein
MKIIKATKTGSVLFLISIVSMFCNKTNTTISDYKVELISISPASGNSNTAVTLKGKGFSLILTEDSVRFNGKIALITQSTDSSILAYAPAGGSTGNITLTVNGDSVSGPVFTYDASTAPTPVITSVVYNGIFNIGGQNFGPQPATVTIGSQLVTGFTYSDQGNGQNLLSLQNYVPASDLNNPVPITVTVSNQTSNAYSFLFYPVINSINPDTVSDNETVIISGRLFGDRTVASTVKAFYVDQGGNKIYMTPDPTVISWNTNTIQITMMDYGSYPIGNGVQPFYLEVNVGSKSTNASVRFHIE